MPRLAVKLTQRAGVDTIEGPAGDGSLRVRVRAAPADGAANAALVDLLAETLGVPRNELRVVAGLRSTRKLVEVDEQTWSVVTRLWPGLVD